MVGGQRAEGSPEQRVRARGEHRQALVALAVSLGAPLDAEADGGALGAADPLALHAAPLLRPAVAAGERAQPFAGDGGDLEEPPQQLAPPDRRALTPTPAVAAPPHGPPGLA